MSAAQSRRPLAETARLGSEIIEHRIQPKLGPEDDDKFVAVDVDSEDYEIHQDDYTAIMLLRGRRPLGDFWLGRVGRPTVYRMGGRSLTWLPERQDHGAVSDRGSGDVLDRASGITVLPGIVPQGEERFQIGDPLVIRRADGSHLNWTIDSY